jgi:hypothetical protein
MVERQPERDLPAQIEAHGLHRLSIREAAAVGKQEDPRERARRDRGPSAALAVALDEIPIADDPLAVLGQKPVERVARDDVAAPRRIKEPC